MDSTTTDAFNAASHLVHRHVEQGRGQRLAVRAGTGTGTEGLTYAGLASLLRRTGTGLRELGLRRDDRVLMVMSDDVPMLATILGSFDAGLVAVPVSTMLTGPELGGIVADSGARVVVCTEEFTGVVTEALRDAPEVEHVVHVGAPGPLRDAGRPLHDWDDVVAAGATAIEADPGRDAPAPTVDDSWALWLYTSGTTGKPKAAMHRHANIRHVCETYGDQVLQVSSEDLTFSVAKMFFAYGIGNTVFFPLSVGACTVLEPRRPTPAVVLERLRAERPTLFFAVPTFYAALVASDLPDDAFAGVRWCASAGEPLPAPLQRRFTDRFGVEILDGIGSTEALHIFLSNSPGDVRPGTTGKAVPGYDVEVRDALGAVAAPGQPGALFVRGDSIALGYWHRTDATRQVFQGSWLSTGDTYVRDEDGYYRCLGRNSDMLKSGGIWVSPAEVESRLLEHASVREAAVVGVADDDGIDKPVAVVVAADDVTPDDLIGWCRDGLAHFKAPRQVVFVDELPKTATGKLQRFKVRALLVGSSSDDVDVEPAATAADHRHDHRPRSRPRVPLGVPPPCPTSSPARASTRWTAAVSRSAPSTASTRASASSTSTPRSASTAAPASRSAPSRRSARTAASPTATSSTSRTTARSSPRCSRAAGSRSARPAARTRPVRSGSTRPSSLGSEPARSWPATLYGCTQVSTTSPTSSSAAPLPPAKETRHDHDPRPPRTTGARAHRRRARAAGPQRPRDP